MSARRILRAAYTLYTKHWLGFAEFLSVFACLLLVQQVDELLRHLWSLIPCNTDEKRIKMERIQVTMLPELSDWDSTS